MPTDVLKPGAMLAGCIVEDILGVGGMGVVYRAKPVHEGTVAVKLMHPKLATQADLVRRFRDEVRACRLLDHPSVVPVLDAGETDEGCPFLVMPYIAGKPLGVALEDGGPMSLRRASAIITQLLDALAHVHGAGIVHADIKSDNVLLASGDRVTLIDFGLAKLAGETRPAGDDRMLSGTPEYMAPEVIRGESPTALSDLYGVGVILYELLTGTTPFGGGEPVEIMARHVDDEAVPPSLRCPDRHLPSALERVVMRALEKAPGARFSSARSFARALAHATPTDDFVTLPSRRRDSEAHARTETPTRSWKRETSEPGEAASAGERRLCKTSEPGEAASAGERRLCKTSEPGEAASAGERRQLELSRRNAHRQAS